MTKDKEYIEFHLKSIVANLPENPGIYQYLDINRKIIYVGKAKNLKKRVSSYFNKKHPPGKTRVLVNKITDIKYIVVNSEEDALLLENNLIKKHQPRYNVLLKDDKTYPSICVTNEYFPRILKTRTINKKYGTFYGPYSHFGAMQFVLNLIFKLYPIRRCRLDLTEENIKRGKFDACLEFHIKNCKAPCIGKQSHLKYMKDIIKAQEILKGNTKEISKELYNEMQSLAAEMRFEEAEEKKRQFIILEKYRSKSEIVSATYHNIDVFSIAEEEKKAFINYLHVKNGCINHAYTFEFKKKLNESKEELISLAIIEMRTRYNSVSREIILPFELDLPLKNVSITIPQRGEKKKLLDLSLLNVKQYKLDRLKEAEKINPEQKRTKTLKEIQKELGLNKLPLHIECFDNSNIQGSDAVAGCVVFKKGKPSKKEYRRYIIKTVQGPDDYASMEEVVYRRYKRILQEGKELPDLIITDGGKGQMGSVKKIIKDQLKIDIPIVGLAKDDKHQTRELLFGFPVQTVRMRPESLIYKFMFQIQEEVHRYAIAFHRERRRKRQITSELDLIPGIGKATKKKLLTHFKSVKHIKEAHVDEVIAIIGKSKGKIIIEKLINKE